MSGLVMVPGIRTRLASHMLEIICYVKHEKTGLRTWIVPGIIDLSVTGEKIKISGWYNCGTV